MFFLSLYLLYKSRKNSKLLYYALGALLIAIDTHTAGLVLTPFFIGFILLYHKPKWLASIPGALLLRDFISALRVSTSGVGESLRGVYFERYSWYLRNIHYMLVLFVPGVIWGFFKQRLLTLLLVVPALILLFSLLSVKVFAFRYMYFSIFILVLYSSLLISFLYEKYGKIVLISLVALVLLPSNLFFPLAGSIILDPVSTSFDDPSAPYTDYKSLDGSLVNDLRSGVLVSLFSSDVEWYIKKPDYVIPFSMSGMGNDSISLNGVDRYSGALILDYSFVSGYVIADGFSVSKLNSLQREEFDLFVNGCELVENNQDLRVYYCSESLKSK